MRLGPILLALTLALLLAACGGKEDATTDGSGNGGSTGDAKPKGSSNPVASLTAERLDEYLAILKEGGEDAVQLAAKRGWNVMEWARTHAGIKAVVKAGGIDTYLERLQKKLEESEPKLAEMKANLESASEKQRAFFEKGVESITASQDGWRRTLDDADAMRKGGALIEARMDEIREALGR